MRSEDQKSILAIALIAAFSDGAKDDRERAEIRRIAELLTGESGSPDMTRLVQDVLLKRVTVEQASDSISEPALRQLAYEMALAVCEIDGPPNPAEQKFLAELRDRLRLHASEAAAIEREVDAYARIDGIDGSAASATAAGPAITAASAGSGSIPRPHEAELDRSILNYALLNGALELLPQSWASMAIIPLQIRMVYGIGKAHGIALDQGHIKEFIAAAGVGLTSQYLEQFGRKLIGGLLGKAAGKAFGLVGRAATGMAFSFATTYALGHVAKRYYAGGRVMSTELLRQTFQDMLGPAKEMQSRYLPQIQEKAATLDAGLVMALVRGH